MFRWRVWCKQKSGPRQILNEHLRRGWDTKPVKETEAGICSRKEGRRQAKEDSASRNSHWRLTLTPMRQVKRNKDKKCLLGDNMRIFQ